MSRPSTSFVPSSSRKTWMPGSSPGMTKTNSVPQNERGGTGCPIPPQSFMPKGNALVVQRARLDLHARPHGGGDRDALDVGAFGTRRLCLGDGIRERLDVLHQL